MGQGGRLRLAALAAAVSATVTGVEVAPSRAQVQPFNVKPDAEGNVHVPVTIPVAGSASVF